jgi:hypothetical protein
MAFKAPSRCKLDLGIRTKNCCDPRHRPGPLGNYPEAWRNLSCVEEIRSWGQPNSVRTMRANGIGSTGRGRDPCAHAHFLE